MDGDHCRVAVVAVRALLERQHLFGNAIALSAAGSTLAVGANGEDSTATGICSDQLDNSVSAAGTAYVFLGHR